MIKEKANISDAKANKLIEQYLSKKNNQLKRKNDQFEIDSILAKGYSYLIDGIKTSKFPKIEKKLIKKLDVRTLDFFGFKALLPHIIHHKLYHKIEEFITYATTDPHVSKTFKPVLLKGTFLTIRFYDGRERDLVKKLLLL